MRIAVNNAQFQIARTLIRERVPLLVFGFLLAVTLLVAGCAKYNTYYNAKKNFDDAEHVREEALKKTGEAPSATGNQRTNYDKAIKKCQKLLDEYPGHSLTDDALFLQGKAYHRLESYRMSIRKLDLLFLNYPATEYLEEAYYLQGLNYLLLGSLANSQDFLDKLDSTFPDSEYQAETRRVSGENAFTMEKYEDASREFLSYLNDFPKAGERDVIGLKLARCYWEMHEYYPAIEVLQEVSDVSNSVEVSFRARLLRARVHVKMKDFEIVELLLVGLKDEAEIYSSQGEVRLVEVESLVAQGKMDEATPLLESMPVEWQKPEVKARAADILGYSLMHRGEWEDAKKEFQTAVRGNDVLDDINQTKSLLKTLGVYLGAEQGLVDASGPKVGRLKLLQANAMFFGFDNPSEAARLYREAAVDTASDSTVVVRALYGAHLAYDDYLDMPDSAAFFADELIGQYPNSAQALYLQSDGDVNILDVLLVRKKEQQEVALANLTDEERAALVAISEEMTTESVNRPIASVKTRRRMVYLKMRDNLIFEPTETMLNKKQIEQDAAVAAAAEAATAAALRMENPLEQVSMPDSTGVSVPDSLHAVNKSALPVPVTSDALSPAGEEDSGEKAKAEEEEDDEFDLR